jgi:hypothetical protein
LISGGLSSAALLHRPVAAVDHLVADGVAPYLPDAARKTPIG